MRLDTAHLDEIILPFSLTVLGITYRNRNRLLNSSRSVTYYNPTKLETKPSNVWFMEDQISGHYSGPDRSHIFHTCL